MISNTKKETGNNSDGIIKLDLESDIYYDDIGKIKNIAKMKDCYFLDVYKRLFNLLDDIKTKNIKNEKDIKNEKLVNNCIAIVGDRGEGKTSALLSFHNMINESDNIKIDNDSDKDLNTNEIKVLDLIDPSLLKNNDSLIEIIISYIFKEFKNMINKKDSTGENIDQIVQLFQKVFENIKIIKEHSDLLEMDDSMNIESLSKLSVTTEMKKTFKKLIDKFLNMCKKKTLLISIDDLDLNLDYAQSLFEQIRKFLIIPNVVIVMGIKMEQIEDSVFHEFINKREKLININEFNSGIQIDKINKMVYKYVNKIIPLSNRVYLPKLNKNSHQKKYNIKGEENNNDKEMNIQHKLLSEIYKKTGLIFAEKQYGKLHPLFPNSMRELNNFVDFLESLEVLKNISLKKMYNLDDLEKDDNPFRFKLKKNIGEFEKYFLNYWLPNNIKKRKHIEFINELNNISYKKLNHFVVHKLSNYMEKIFKNEYNLDKNDNNNYEFHHKILNEKDITEFNNIINLTNLPENISYGDIIYLLNLYDKYDNNKEGLNLRFAIKTFYSILLTEIIFINRNQKENRSERRWNTELINIIGGDMLGKFSERIFVSDDCLSKFHFKYGTESYNEDYFKYLYEDPNGSEIPSLMYSLRNYVGIYTGKDVFKDFDIENKKLKLRNFTLLNSFLSFDKIDGNYRKNVEISRYSNQYFLEPWNNGGFRKSNFRFSINNFFFNLLLLLENDYINLYEKIFGYKDEEDMTGKIEGKSELSTSIEDNLILPIYSFELMTEISNKINSTWYHRRRKDKSYYKMFLKFFSNSDVKTKSHGSYRKILETLEEEMKYLIINENDTSVLEEIRRVYEKSEHIKSVNEIEEFEKIFEKIFPKFSEENK